MAVKKYVKKYECLHCDFESKKKIGLEQHVFHNHCEKYACSLCEFYAKDKNDLRYHNKIKHPPKFVCNLCDYSGSNKNVLQRHIRTKVHKKVLNYEQDTMNNNVKTAPDVVITEEIKEIIQVHITRIEKRIMLERKMPHFIFSTLTSSSKEKHL